MSDDGIKRVNITGAAASDLEGGAKKGRRSTKKKQEGGSPIMGAVDALRGVSPNMAAIKGVETTAGPAVAAASSNSNSWLKYPVGAPVPPRIVVEPSHIPSTPERAAAPTGQYAQAGGKDQRHIKVELKKKTTVKKVHLNPKKAEAPKHSSKKHQTRKARKVSIGVSSFHKRITRAKKLHKTAKEMPLDKLKEKLIKANSKAPESVLRQIAGDAEVVAKKAL